MASHWVLLITSYSLLIKNGGLAQLARAPALHAGGHRFDSDILHLLNTMYHKGGANASNYLLTMFVKAEIRFKSF